MISYIVGGWTISILMLIGASLLGQPYHNAPAWKWFLLLFFANFGYILADGM
jgi:hypothetical protein